MKYLLIIYLALISPTNNDFPSNSFDKVVVYILKETIPFNRLFDNKGGMNNIDSGIIVSNLLVSELLDVVNDTLSYGAFHCVTRSPNIGVVFYKNDEVIDWLEIDLNCNLITTKII